MRYDFIYAALLLGFGTFLLLGAVFTLSRKDLVLGIRLIGLIALSAMFQLYGYASILLTDSEVTMLAVSRLESLGTAFFFTIWFILAYQQNRRVQKIPFKKVWIFLVIPFLMFILGLIYPHNGTQPQSWLAGTFYSGHEIVTYAAFGSGFFGIVFTKGFGFYLLSIYNILMSLGAMFYYYRSFKKAKKSVKNKAIIMVFISLLLSVIPLYGLFYDKTAVLDFSAFLGSVVLVYSFAILYGKEFMDLIPTAQAKLFQYSDFPVFIIDKSHIMINVNLKAREIYRNELDFDELVLLDDLDGIHPGFSKELLAFGKTEISRPEESENIFYQVRLIELKKRRNKLLGYLMYFADITDHKLEIQEMEYIANYDDLTKILNRRAFYIKASEAFVSASQKGERFSLIMFDLDGFKEVNDEYGHQSGDLVLNEMAKIIIGELNKKDIFGRYGGEEFIIFARDISPDEAGLIAERIRQKLECYPFCYNDNQIHITASFGISGSIDRPDKTLKQYIADSDKGLYIAKSEGKNKVVVIS